MSTIKAFFPTKLQMKNGPINRFTFLQLFFLLVTEYRKLTGANHKNIRAKTQFNRTFHCLTPKIDKFITEMIHIYETGDEQVRQLFNHCWHSPVDTTGDLPAFGTARARIFIILLMVCNQTLTIWQYVESNQELCDLFFDLMHDSFGDIDDNFMPRFNKMFLINEYRLARDCANEQFTKKA
jgi:hypothetical protein